jgi:hypothetical protein
MLIFTGMSGACRATVGNALEDLRWYVVDYLPPQMLRPLVELVQRAGTSLPRLAAVVDIRGRDFFYELQDIIQALRAGVNVRVVFLDANDAVLVRRFESVRRPHPLQGDGTLLDGIGIERARLATLREASDIVVDTSEDLNPVKISDWDGFLARLGSAFGGFLLPAEEHERAQAVAATVALFRQMGPEAATQSLLREWAMTAAAQNVALNLDEPVEEATAVRMLQGAAPIRAVYRIEHPDVVCIRVFRSEFFPNNAMLREFRSNHFPHQLLGAAIRCGNNRTVCLLLDSQISSCEVRLYELSAGTSKFESELTVCFKNHGPAE